jgi:hypothetical protein
MRKTYLKTLIAIVILLWSIYFIQIYYAKQEPFIPKINSLYRPCVRHINGCYENFMNNYGPNVVLTKLKKWNVY